MNKNSANSGVKILTTGCLRDIANSAWISTMDEVKVKARSDEDVERVVTFLAKNLHTSPFEVVTISATSKKAVPDLYPYYKNKYARFDGDGSPSGFHLTIDLLNFAKVSYQNNFNTILWNEFEKEKPKLAEIVKMINFSMDETYPEDVSSELGNHNMAVEVVSAHMGVDKKNSRVTWRVKCPLSIAVQLLRHRSGGYNMVSGRYKTIRQTLFERPLDIENICAKSNIDLTRMEETMDSSRKIYLSYMKELKQRKDDESITNDEYKRMREYVRFILPEGRMTELYVSFYLDHFEHYLKLRNSKHAQIEHIWIAQQMELELKEFLKNNNKNNFNEYHKE